MDLQSCWECSSTCYTPIQCQTTTIQQPTWCHTPILMAKHCLRVGRKSRSEAWNLPTCGCKSMVDGLTIMLGVFINLLYTHTMPNNHYCSTYMMPYPHLMAKRWLRVGRKSRFFPDLRHETCLHVAVKVWWRDLQSCLSVHQLVIYPCNAKQPLLQHLHDGIPPLDGQTLPGSRQKINIWGMKPAHMWL